MKKVMWVSVACGAVLTAVSVIVPFFLISPSESTGDIVTAEKSFGWLEWFFEWADGYGVAMGLFGAALLLTALLIALSRRSAKSSFSGKSMGIAVGMGGVLSLGLLCVIRLTVSALLGGIGAFPATMWFCIIAGLLCVVAGILLVRWYIKERKALGGKRWCAPDLGAAALYVVPFLYLFGKLTGNLG